MISATTQGVGKTIIPVPAGNQLSACNHAVPPPGGAKSRAPAQRRLPFQAKRSGQNIKSAPQRKRYFEEFLMKENERRCD
jgi:hypothetical protein